MSAISTVRMRQQFTDYAAHEHESLARAAKSNKQMLTDFGEQSGFKDFRRKLAWESPESVTPTGFLRSERSAAHKVESRNLQVWKLRRLEKKRLWFQDVMMACQGLLHNWQRFNPFRSLRSFDDQIRASVRKSPSPPMNMAPLSRAVRMRTRKGPLSSRLKAS